MRNAAFIVRHKKHRHGFTLIEMMIVLTLVVIFAGLTAVYNKGIGRQIVLTREHAIALGQFVRARSAGLTIPKGDPGEIICGYGVHIDTASRTFTYFKDLGVVNCAATDHVYTVADGVIEQRTLGDVVTVTSNIGDITYAPPFGKVYVDGVADMGTVATVRIESATADAFKGITANAFGQISEF